MSVIDDYLQNLEPPQKAELERVRAVVKEVVPDAEDTIGYGMPVLKYKGKYLIGFCQFKNHMSVFPGPESIEAIKDKLAGFTIAKGTIQFTTEKPLPKSVLKALTEIRMKEIAAKGK